MPVPDYQRCMRPLLRLACDEREHTVAETIERLADEFELTEDESRELLQSGRQAKFDNRVGWARTYLQKAGLLETAGGEAEHRPARRLEQGRRGRFPTRWATGDRPRCP